MADPRIMTLEQRQAAKANLSELMQKKATNVDGKVINMCQCGCADEDLDEYGYCYHLVGFTVPGNDKLMEPYLPPDERGVRKMLGAKPEAVKAGDKLVRITVSSRVYRESAKSFKKKSEAA